MESIKKEANNPYFRNTPIASDGSVYDATFEECKIITQIPVLNNS
jgi:hypothetical protein